jgi:hypothetical protein
VAAQLGGRDAELEGHLFGARAKSRLSASPSPGASPQCNSCPGRTTNMQHTRQCLKPGPAVRAGPRPPWRVAPAVRGRREARPRGARPARWASQNACR